MAAKAEEFPLILAVEALDELKRLLETTFSTPTVTARAFEMGAVPPDQREGWTVAYAYGPDGKDLGLVWSEPSYPED